MKNIIMQIVSLLLVLAYQYLPQGFPLSENDFLELTLWLIFSYILGWNSLKFAVVRKIKKAPYLQSAKNNMLDLIFPGCKCGRE